MGRGASVSLRGLRRWSRVANVDSGLPSATSRSPAAGEGWEDPGKQQDLSEDRKKLSRFRAKGPVVFGQR
ncbi:hypothetical protein GN956_G5101 [Arapaima gigas]